jgi:Xaa-Pro aminopeptidase
VRPDFVNLAAAGAVFVQGSQAHQAQGFEFYGDSLIHYGLGNLFFDQYGYLNARGERVSRTLQAGMVLTIEPGLYVRPADNVPEVFWNIGIRIEDDAVVTTSGCELISRGVPVEADAIETLMRG